jgi:hypothetical protein
MAAKLDFIQTPASAQLYATVPIYVYEIVYAVVLTKEEIGKSVYMVLLVYQLMAS